MGLSAFSGSTGNSTDNGLFKFFLFVNMLKQPYGRYICLFTITYAIIKLIVMIGLFISYGLENKFTEELYKDFEELTLDFYHKGNNYGLEKYW